MPPAVGAPRLQAPLWFVLGLMSSVTFVGILSELVPSGILPQMTEGLGVSESRIGMLVGVYALASAVFTIPLISATLAVNRKHLLLALLAGFAVSNVVVGLSSSYAVILAARVAGGICAGVMWPMIAAYGTRLVPPEQHGRAITVIMAGTTLGISLGLPAMTLLGATLGWRTEFVVLGLVAALIATLSQRYLPAVGGERLSRGNSPLTLLGNPAILVVLLLTLLAVAAHYGVYTYITLLVKTVHLAGGVAAALLIFGAGSVIAVVLSARWIDAHLRTLIITMLVLGGVSMVLLLAFARTAGVAHLAFFLWGLSYGPLGSAFQAAIVRQVHSGKDVATSLQSCMFNLSIMLATWAGGVLLVRLPEGGMKGVVYLSLGCFALAAALALLARRTLRVKVAGAE